MPSARSTAQRVEPDPPGSSGHLILAIETSGRCGSVALARGAHVIEETALAGGLKHSRDLLPTIDALCRRHGVGPADVHDVYFSGGPGSFTGLRIAATVARTLAMARGVGIVRVPTLDVIAQNALAAPNPPARLAVILDAKRNHVYAAEFTLDVPDLTPGAAVYRRCLEPAELDPDDFFAALPRPCAVLGEGIAYHASAVDRSNLDRLPDDLNRPRAAVVHRLGFALASAGCSSDAAMATVTPIYIRAPEAEEVWARRNRAD